MSGSRGFCCVLAVAACAFACPDAARAARPMVTDDARVVDSKSCQVESWLRHNVSGGEFWALPACNFFTDLELTFGGASATASGHSRVSDVLVQAKQILRPLERDGWGSAIAVGQLAHTDAGRPRHPAGDAYASVLNSLAFAGDRLVLHTNLGASHERAARQNRLTWGVGAEAQLWPRGYLIAEAFGRDVGRPWFQLGLRVWLVPDRVQVDATFGNRFGQAGDERWMTVGLRLLSPRWLP